MSVGVFLTNAWLRSLSCCRSASVSSRHDLHLMQRTSEHAKKVCWCLPHCCLTQVPCLRSLLSYMHHSTFVWCNTLSKKQLQQSLLTLIQMISLCGYLVTYFKRHLCVAALLCISKDIFVWLLCDVSAQHSFSTARLWTYPRLSSPLLCAQFSLGMAL